MADQALTKAQARALMILDRHAVAQIRRRNGRVVMPHHRAMRPREFAAEMWPDSPAWNRVAKCGQNGVHRGGGMYLAAGGFLGKLSHTGLVEYTGWESGYCITRQGIQALEDAGLRGH